MSAYATNAVVVAAATAEAPAGALGLVLAADAEARSVKLLWAAFDQGAWTQGQGWAPVDTLSFLTRECFADEVRQLHARMAAYGHVVRYLPPCGHTNAAAAFRDFCACCEHTPYATPGSVAVVNPAAGDQGAALAGTWVSFDPSYGGHLRIDAEPVVAASDVRDFSADEMVELLAGLPREPWAALLALHMPGLSNPQQDLLGEHAVTVMPGLVNIGDAIAVVVTEDGDDLIVHLLGAGTVRSDNNDLSEFGIRADDDPVRYHAEDNRFNADDVTVIEHGNVLSRVSKSLTSPVTLTEWLAGHDQVLASAYASGVDDGRSW